MKLKNETKNTLFATSAYILSFMHLDHVIGEKHKGVGAIIVFHSVVENADYFFNDELRTNITYLDKIIKYFLMNRIDILSLDSLVERLKSGVRRPFVVFTFDDGFKDNLNLALPIFENYRAPFTVYVTNCMSRGDIDNWWSGLAQIIRMQDKVTVDELGMTFQATSRREKSNLYSILKEKISNSVLSKEGLAILFKKYSVNLSSIIKNEAMSEEEIRRLSSSPFVNIGGHTVSHPHLSRLDADEARRELLENKLWLENLIDQEVRHVAYPFGGIMSCGPREAQLAKEVGFKTGVTTRIGNLFEEHLDHLAALPRIRPFNKYKNTRLIEFQVSGGAGALLNRARGPVVTM